MPTFSQGQKGAQILEASLATINELLYLSPLAVLNPDKPIRGGIPLMFPQFGDFGPLSKHGFARDMDWILVDAVHEGHIKRAAHELRIGSTDLLEWPHAAALQFVVLTDENGIGLDFSVTNTGDSPFSFTGGFHPYFRISSRADVEIKGFESLSHKDSFPGDDAYLLQSDKLVERQYLGNSEVNLFNGTAWLKLVATGFDSWMVWNPGREGARKISDLPDEDWDKFICVEPIVLSNPIQLEHGKTINFRLQISLQNVL